MTLEEVREKLEELNFQIIASVGTARSMHIEALNMAKEGKFDKAGAHIDEVDKMFAGDHNAHHDILTLQGQGIEIPLTCC